MTLPFGFAHTYINKLQSALKTYYLVISHWTSSKLKKIFLYQSLNLVLLFPEFIIFEFLRFTTYHNNNCPFSSTTVAYCLYFLSYLSSTYSIPIFFFYSHFIVAKTETQRCPVSHNKEDAEPRIKPNSFWLYSVLSFGCQMLSLLILNPDSNIGGKKKGGGR